ncbi:hypothetical protein BT96DRAFT_972699 [Gymnopus androsaceus JB14]|uniref:Uncharacterized protein n=1 Tax=Gymnopus androsaceus JB14 TaxID=1447944 RepID=A0A6A4I8K6_9AGAR|nr:hypothetical protein BT96DRAFT_972699 [Gymnopus androsaceus JB14]
MYMCVQKFQKFQEVFSFLGKALELFIEVTSSKSGMIMGGELLIQKITSCDRPTRRLSTAQSLSGFAFPVPGLASSHFKILNSTGTVGSTLFIHTQPSSFRTLSYCGSSFMSLRYRGLHWPHSAATFLRKFLTSKFKGRRIPKRVNVSEFNARRSSVVENSGTQILNRTRRLSADLHGSTEGTSSGIEILPPRPGTSVLPVPKLIYSMSTIRLSFEPDKPSFILPSTVRQISRLICTSEHRPSDASGDYKTSVIFGLGREQVKKRARDRQDHGTGTEMKDARVQNHSFTSAEKIGTMYFDAFDKEDSVLHELKLSKTNLDRYRQCLSAAADVEKDIRSKGIHPALLRNAPTQQVTVFE